MDDDRGFVIWKTSGPPGTAFFGDRLLSAGDDKGLVRGDDGCSCSLDAGILASFACAAATARWRLHHNAATPQAVRKKATRLELPPNLIVSAIERVPEANPAAESADEASEIRTLLGVATTASPDSATPPTRRLDAFTPDFPSAARAAEAAIATRVDSDKGGEPVRLLPFTIFGVPAAALRAAARTTADAAVTLLLVAAAATAAAVATAGSAAKATADTLVVVFTCAANSDTTRTINDTAPSAATTIVGTIVMFEGAKPPASLARLSVAAERTLSLTASMTEASELPGGRKKEYVCVTGAATTWENDKYTTSMTDDGVEDAPGPAENMPVEDDEANELEELGVLDNVLDDVITEVEVTPRNSAFVALTELEMVNASDALLYTNAVALGVTGGTLACIPDGFTVTAEVDESEHVLDELAPLVKDAVGVRDADRERLDEEVGVIVGEPVLELVGVLVGVPLLVSLGETLGLSETLAVTLALAPTVTDGVAELDSEALREDVDEGVDDDVLVPEVDSEPVPVCVGVCVDVIDADDEADDEGDGDKEDDGVPLAVPPTERVVVGVVVTVVERLRVDEPLSLPDGV